MTADQLPDDFESLLLGEQMDLLEPDQRDQLKQALARDPELQAKQQRIDKILEPLDAWTAPSAPPNLAASVMAHVETADKTFEFVHPTTGQTDGMESRTFSALMSLREIVAVAAAILIIVGVFVPNYYGVSQQGNPANHVMNLSTMAGGITNYADDLRSLLPPSPGRPNASWLTPAAYEQPRGPASLHPYLQVRVKHVNPRLVIRPVEAAAGSADRFEGLDEVVSPRWVNYRWRLQLDPTRRSLLDVRAHPRADATLKNLRALPDPLDDVSSGSLMSELDDDSGTGDEASSDLWQRASYRKADPDGSWCIEPNDDDAAQDVDIAAGASFVTD